MAVTAKRLAEGDTAVAQTTRYTVPAGASAIIKNVILCNTTAMDKTITVKSGGSTIMNAMPVPANSTATFDFSLVMPAGTTLTTAASAVGIHLTVSGVEVAV